MHVYMYELSMFNTIIWVQKKEIRKIDFFFFLANM